ncbi:integrase [Crossiella equi]|uniref:Integrase n=1 Tax=Crossiella equi TaxID=130796 RepID=A0ABS5ABQ7_9PSEU|nr:site-specific integrase [Crossiella equi]MBP2474022.1 integrase [Crossiella equi]
MGRPPLPIGTYGKIRHHQTKNGWRAIASFRDFDGVTRPVERVGRSKSAAERELKKALLERTQPAQTQVTGDTKFREVAELWMAEVGRQRKGTTYDTHRVHMDNHTLPGLGELRIREVTVGRVDAFLRACERKPSPRGGLLSANTVRSIRSTVSGPMSLAARYGATAANPVRDAGRIEGVRKKVRALTHEERQELLAKLDADQEAKGHDIPDLVRFMLGTGCRIGEAIAVQDDAVTWNARDAEIDICANIVRIKGKGLVRHEGKTFKSQRVLPLPGFVFVMLQVRRPVGVRPDTTLFPNTLGGWRDPHNTGARLREALRRAGFTWVTSHVFRKTAITILDEAGLTGREISGHAGHARVSTTTDIYMDRRAQGRGAADALDSAMGSGGA